MYDNIGEKIKGLAKLYFYVEAILAIIIGIALWIETEDAWCVLIIILGPLVAWVSSWLLYGFGELITKTCEIEENTRNAVLRSAKKEGVTPVLMNPIQSNVSAFKDVSHRWRCSCGGMRTQTPCEHCGKE